MKGIRLLLTTLVFYILGFSLHAQEDFDTRLKSLHKTITSEMKKHKATGLSVAFMHEGKMLWSTGFGYADQSQYLPAHGRTVYPIGSISKMLTHTAVMKLVEDGKVSLDSSYNNYVPDFHMRSHGDMNRPMTILDLMTHQAGIPRIRIKNYFSDDPRPFEEILKEGRNDYLIAPPGEVYQYSDWGVTLLGVLIERVSGKEFREYVRESVIEPLGMAYTTYDRYEQIPEMSNGYWKHKETKTFRGSAYPSDGVQSTVNDLLKLAYPFIHDGRSISGEQFINPRLVKKMTTRQNTQTPLAYDRAVGLGWHLNNFYQFNTITHGGDQSPFITQLTLVPEHQLSIAVATNSNFDWDLVYKVRNEVLKAWYETQEIPLFQDKVKMEPAKLTYEQKQMVKGHYATSIGLVEFEPKKDKFKVTLYAENNKKLIARPYEGNTLKLEYRLLGIIPFHVMDVFMDNRKGELYIGEQTKSGKRYLGGKKIERIPIPENWYELKGHYEITNLENEYEIVDMLRITTRGGFLALEGSTIYPSTPKIQVLLQPVNDKEAIIEGIGSDLLGETVKLREIDGETHIQFSGYEFKKIVEQP